jgi:opacity protein-like surface antigen
MMLKRFGFLLLLACALVAAAPVHAAAQQTFNFTLGGFVVSGDDAREDDVLNENRNFLAFDVDDFNGAAVGAEWLVPVGQFFEAGAGLSFYRRTVPSVYEEFVDRDGSEIEQDLRLRIVPLTATVRVLPLAQRSGVQPYFGVGVGVFNWRYSEAGEFVDFTDNSIFREEYVASGNEIGPVALGGIRFAGDTIAAGFEIRYQDVKGELDDRFSSDRIDLGGWTYNFTLGFRF